MKKKTLLWILLIVIVAIGSYFVWNTQSKKTAQDKEVVKIGAVLPLTGNIAFLGESGKNGLLLAEQFINENDLLKDNKKVKFVFSDGMGIPKNSINALQYLLDTEKINIIFSIVSSVDVSFIPIQKEKQFLFLSHATHPSLSGVDSLFFRHSPTVNQEVELIKKYIGKNAGTTVILNSSDDYGFSFVEQMTFLDFINPQNTFAFNATDQDFRSICLKALQKKPSKVVVCGNGRDLYRIINILQEQGYRNEIITTLGFKVGGAFEQIKKTAEFTYIDFKETSISYKYKAILDIYKKRFNKEMTINEMIFFNSALLIVEAMNKSKRNDIREIAKNISDINSFEGLGESITIKPTNDILPSIDLFFNKKK